MERSEWLKLMQKRTEELYDRFSSRYWVTWGLEVEETHRHYLQIFLDRVPRMERSYLPHVAQVGLTGCCWKRVTCRRY
jgi:hypothetical protein